MKTHQQDYCVTVTATQATAYENTRYEVVIGRYYIRATSEKLAVRKAASHLGVNIGYEGIDTDCGQRRYDTVDRTTSVYVRNLTETENGKYSCL